VTGDGTVARNRVRVPRVVESEHRVWGRGILSHVVLNVVNEGGEDRDLAVEGGAKTRTLGPGQSQRLDLGTVVGDRAAWCTLPNHKVAGMTLDIEVVDPSAAKRGERAAGQPAYQTE
jgi:hypothetical protein